MKYFLALTFLFYFTVTNSQEKYPSFEVYVGKDQGISKTKANEFNDFVLENEGKIVYLMIFLDDEQENEFIKYADKNIIWFTVKYVNKSDEPAFGIEYRLHITKENIGYLEYSENRLSGYFKIFETGGPQMSWFWANLRPLKEGS